MKAVCKTHHIAYDVEQGCGDCEPPKLKLVQTATAQSKCGHLFGVLDYACALCGLAEVDFWARRPGRDANGSEV